MTFGLGVRVREGLLGLADTRITSGTEITRGRKIAVYEQEGLPFFLLTSGLRSVRDKSLAYFEQHLENLAAPYHHVFEVVNALAAQVRRVEEEDRAALEASGFAFDINVLVGGQFAADRGPRLYLLYPQGNWVEIGEGTPYQIIGVGGYGKPLLDRAAHFEDSLRHVLRVGILSFDSTRISSSNVDYPIDVVLFETETRRMITHRFEQPDLAGVSAWWQSRLRSGVLELPHEWEDPLFAKLNGDRHPA